MAREVAEHRIAFPNSAGTIARDEASRDMDQRRAFHPARKSDDVLRADDVRAQAALECGIESYVAGGVDDDVDIVGDGLCFFFAVAEVCLGDVAASDDDFVVDETFERAAVTFAQRIEWRRGNDVVPETILRLFLRTRAHGEIDLADVRKAMQQHAQRYFAEKARASDQEDLSVSVDFSRR